MQKEIIIKGSIGNTERQNRDNMRVLSGGYHLHAEIPHYARQTNGNKKNKKIVGQISNHQWGVVYSGDGVAPCMQARDYKDAAKVVKRWKNKS